MGMAPGSYDIEVTFNINGGGSGTATITLIVAPGNSRTVRDLERMAEEEAERVLPAQVRNRGVYGLSGKLR